jgi:hypothetical protein
MGVERPPVRASLAIGGLLPNTPIIGGRGGKGRAASQLAAGCSEHSRPFCDRVPRYADVLITRYANGFATVQRDAGRMVERVPARALHNGRSPAQRLTQQFAEPMHQCIEGQASERELTVRPDRAQQRLPQDALYRRPAKTHQHRFRLAAAPNGDGLAVLQQPEAAE